jgi:hypothetical protein
VEKRMSSGGWWALATGRALGVLSRPGAVLAAKQRREEKRGEGVVGRNRTLTLIERGWN